MTKAKLVSIIAKRGHLPRKAANEAVDIMMEEIIRSLAKGEKVVISGFGTFYLSKVKDKQVVPFGREDKRQTVKAHRVVNFRVGKPLKKAVW